MLIPETYVADLQLRLGLYRRLSTLETRAEIDAFAAELVDRFGELPEEVEHLLDVMEIKGLCRQAGIAQVDAGPKGAVIAFRKNQFANPEGLVRFMSKSRRGVKLQPDHKLVFKADWDLPEKRLKGVRALVRSSPTSRCGQEGGVRDGSSMGFARLAVAHGTATAGPGVVMRLQSGATRVGDKSDGAVPVVRARRAAVGGLWGLRCQNQRSLEARGRVVVARRPEKKESSRKTRG